MATTYLKPLKFLVENLITGGEFLTALSQISLPDEDGKQPITPTVTFSDFATVK